jgi:hypothetical protein
MLHELRTEYNVFIYFLYDLGLDRGCAVVHLYILLYVDSFTCETVLQSPVARNAMMTRWPTLILAVTVAFMASRASAAPSQDQSSPAARGPVVTRFVCAHCTNTGQLSSRGLFLNRVAVRRHIARSKQCFQAKLGYREIQVAARPGDGMAGPGGGAGPAPDVRHQRPGETSPRDY